MASACHIHLSISIKFIGLILSDNPADRFSSTAGTRRRIVWFHVRLLRPAFISVLVCRGRDAAGGERNGFWMAHGEFRRTVLLMFWMQAPFCIGRAENVLQPSLQSTSSSSPSTCGRKIKTRSAGNCRSHSMRSTQTHSDWVAICRVYNTWQYAVRKQSVRKTINFLSLANKDWPTHSR